MSGKIAVILFNLGGPDEPSAIRPFLYNLFSDPAIIGLPGGVRQLLAWVISTRRAKKAKGIYALMGGRSPILPETQKQAQALEKKLAMHGDYSVFPCMRYWHPRSDAVVREARAAGAERVILLPLYPQFSTTTTASSFHDWEQAARGVGWRTAKIESYADNETFIDAHVQMIERMLSSYPRGEKPRILFSAHGLPEKGVQAGDPYQRQVEQTVAAIIRARSLAEYDHAICYQSRVGPLKWIGPSTEEEIHRAGGEKKPLLVVPVAFVSEHSETLVELDIEYAELAKHAGVPHYVRVPALGTHPAYIEALAELCLRVNFEKD